jgi:hypothetical protein
MLWAFVFFGGCAVIMGYQAQTNALGLILNGIVHLDPEGATVFYWCIAALGAGMALLGLMLTLIGLTSNQLLSLSETELSAPKWLLSPASTIVPVSSIQRLELKSVGKQHFLKVHHTDGTLTITAANLPDAEAFAEVCAQLTDRHLGPGDDA